MKVKQLEESYQAKSTKGNTFLVQKNQNCGVNTTDILENVKIDSQIELPTYTVDIKTEARLIQFFNAKDLL